MKKISLALFAFSLIFVVFGCKPDTTSEGTMASSSGKPGSVLVVVDSTKFNREVGLEIKKSLSQVYKGLPQPEALFELSDIHPPAFKNIFRKHRNILKVEVAPKYTESRLLIRKDVYARPQLVIHAQAPDDSEMVELFQKKGEVVAQKFVEAERERYIKSYRKISNNGAMMRIKEKFGINIVIPKGYSLDVDTTNFAWIESEGRHYLQGLLIYQFPYKGEQSLTRENLIEQRDQFTKKFVPGPSPASYMITEDQVEPFHKTKKINGNNVVWMRGLWEVENDFMGGPFVSASIVDRERQMVVTVDGYVYAPKFDKRNYVRELEAILHTLK
jgi:hypothetical protein